MIRDAEISNMGRGHIVKYILDKKKTQDFSVIDVGGSANGWSSGVVDAVVDFNEAEWQKNRPNVTVFKGDICRSETWEPIFDYVEKHGKYDLCICTHTLEDVINPAFVCEQISKIAKGGYIAVPSKYRELSRPESPLYLGYIHHRWIFTVEDGSFVGYPKIGYLENERAFDAVADGDENKSDLSFFWEGSVSVDVINGGFLGPSVEAVIGYYRNLLEN